MKATEGVTNKDLFFLLLQKNIKSYVKNNIEISEKDIVDGYNVIEIDFYIGSTGNIAIDQVDIRLKSDIYNKIIFYITKDGKYRNNGLIEKDLNMILNIPNIIISESGKFYETSLLPDEKDNMYLSSLINL